jgi:hypothetical protein
MPKFYINPAKNNIAVAEFVLRGMGEIDNVEEFYDEFNSRLRFALELDKQPERDPEKDSLEKQLEINDSHEIH